MLTVPDFNVEHYAYAVKTEKQLIFPATQFGENEKYFISMAELGRNRVTLENPKKE
ncbi:MAG: hypothetical protein JXB18_02590 [Sedimentisphaerales bacterium]|nr:hypothetical protein [Sedimentisphaerales bacterium]